MSPLSKDKLSPQDKANSVTTTKPTEAPSQQQKHKQPHSAVQKQTNILHAGQCYGSTDGRSHVSRRGTTIRRKVAFRRAISL